MSDYIEFRDVKKIYKMGEVNIEALSGVDFTVNKGEFVVVAGASGAGKSTILNILGGMDSPTSGQIIVDNNEINKYTNKELVTYRRYDIGFVFQDFRLLDSLTIQENIMLPMIINKEEEDIMLDRCNYYAEKVGIKHLLNKKPSNISGGEKQRTAICRALINNPSVIYADEPTGSLDSKTGKTIIDILVNTNIELKKTLIMVTHDPLIASHCSRVIWLKDGLLVHEIRESKKEKLYGEIIEKMKEV